MSPGCRDPGSLEAPGSGADHHHVARARRGRRGPARLSGLAEARVVVLAQGPAGVEIVTAGEPVAFDGGALEWINPYTGERRAIDGLDLLVYATPRTVRDDLGEALSDLELHRVGDCQSPRDLLAAIHGGHALALAL